MTGRENIFLNGAILGMSRAEIRKKFDEIVSFSEVERFLDTPVKRYSSGMYMRLAFAVAAHLEPEILVVDEVLAVGDQAFQNKCLGKMSTVAQEGRTVLFVSHNMAAVESLCTSALMLEAGRLSYSGATSELIARYLSNTSQEAATSDLRNHPGRSRMGEALMESLLLKEAGGRVVTCVPVGGSLTISVGSRPAGRPIRPVLGVVVKTSTRSPLFGVDNRFIPGFMFEPTTAPVVINCHLDSLALQPGRYYFDLFLGDERRSIDSIIDAGHFDVVSSDFYGSGKLPPAKCGPMLFKGRWSIEHAGAASA